MEMLQMRLSWRDPCIAELSRRGKTSSKFKHRTDPLKAQTPATFFYNSQIDLHNFKTQNNNMKKVGLKLDFLDEKIKQRAVNSVSTVTDDMSLVQLGSHLHIEESLRAQDIDKAKGKEVDAIAWWIDYGATTHVCKDRCWFKTYEAAEDGSVLCMGDDHFAPLYGKGSPTVLSFASAEYMHDHDRANCLNTSACVASDIDCRSSCTKTQDLDRMPVETTTVANQVPTIQLPVMVDKKQVAM
uniref:Zinc finger, CCHC-type n=1 Tax=Tanacetum cinerariifolium TaxID=118510 RepID=A0A699H4M3_TANCI|nr:zinc finger, CCHC-type [Tanacetum cinerariifolium]